MWLVIGCEIGIVFVLVIGFLLDFFFYGVFCFFFGLVVDSWLVCFCYFFELFVVFLSVLGVLFLVIG